MDRCDCLGLGLGLGFRVGLGKGSGIRLGVPENIGASGVSVSVRDLQFGASIALFSHEALGRSID
eukprot:1393947-Amorphochlora_amoeboformis.AAC.1